ncbi:MAG: DNA internalization-related competence protein ComEC/Rec2 [Dehalococcoidia bacterium]|nr:DNA internalization-related competence protein ComEC/Rec2 [Dehalococcoidia bacterium]
MKLISLSIAWVVGVFLGSVFSLSLPVVIPLWVLALAAAIIWRRRAACLWGGLCVVTLLGGVTWYQVAVSEPNLQDFSGQRVIVDCRVVRDTQYRDGGAWIGVSAKRVQVGDCSRVASGKLVVYTGPLPSYNQGDVLKIAGVITPLSEISNSGYRSFLKRQGYAGTMDESSQIKLVRSSWLFGFRDRLAESISTALAEPAASLAEGLLLGIRSHMPDQLRADFSRTGTSHLLAISGFNLAVIGGAVLAMAAWVFGRHHAFYLVVTLIIVWLYSALTGMQPPVFRSAIMFSLVLAGLWLGRPGSALTALCFAAAIMVAVDPRVLWDVSFQLSFAAVAGLVIIQPPLQEWGDRAIPEGRWISWVVKPVFSGFTVGFAAIAATLPLMVYYFQSFSVVGLPATVVASVFVTPATMLAGITAVLGLFAPPLAWVVGWVASFFLMCIVATVEWFARLPCASVETGPVSAGVVWGYYFVVLAIAWRGPLKRGLSGASALLARGVDRLGGAAYRLPKKRTVCVLGVCACLVWVAVSALPDTRLTVSFLNVGQGDAILIKTPAGQQVLIDGGPNPDTICQQLGKKMPFWDKSLDMVVLTHSDDDHLVGLMGVLERYRVSRVLESGYGEGPVYREWLRRVEEERIDWIVARAGQQIDLGQGIVLEVVYPHDELLEGTESKVNSNSVVLRLVWDQVSFLLTGDADVAAEHEMLYEDVLRDLDCTVLKVGHHGSKYSTSPEFVAVVDPQVAVISVGEGNIFGHPSEEVLDRLSGVEVYRTDQCGTITFSTDGKRLWVKTAKQ